MSDNLSLVVGPEDDENLDTVTEESFKLPEFVNDYDRLDAALIGTGRGLTRAGQGVKDAFYGATGQDKKRNELQERIAEEKRLWETGIANDLSPTENWAKGGDLFGQIAPSLFIPGKGQTAIPKALWSALTQGTYEGMTTSGGLGDRVTNTLKGAAGAFGGSLGTDVISKGFNGLFGKWGNKAIKEADLRAKDAGFTPSIGELRRKVEGNMGVDDLRKTTPNRPLAMENAAQNTPGAEHKVAVAEAKLKKMLGYTDDISTSKALPQVDADNLSKHLSLKSEEIWKPFNSAANKYNGQGVRPAKLYHALRELQGQNSKVFSDSAAIPSDKVRANLKLLLEAKDDLNVPRFTPEEYSKMVSELGNAQRRLTILSGGTTPSYDAKAAMRMTNAFGSAKDDMAAWAAQKSGKNLSPKELAKRQEIYSHWNEGLKRYQQEITPVRTNPVFETAKNLNKEGRDLSKFADKATDKNLSGHTKDLVKQYRLYGMDDAVKRMDITDTAHRAARSLAGKPVTGSSHIGATILNKPFELISDTAPMKNMYFGKPLADGVTRRSAIGAGRETGDDQLTLFALVKELLGGADEDIMNSSDPQFSHGVGAATQAGTRP